MGLSCLTQFGRFIEIGKRDIYQNSRIPLWSLRSNASFHVVAMDAVFSGDEALTREMLGELAGLVREGRAHTASLPFLPGVLALMQPSDSWRVASISAKSSCPSRSLLPRRGEPLAPPFAIKPDGCYLITGAFGGFGKVLAEWLVKCGANTRAQQSQRCGDTSRGVFVRMRARGVEAKVVRADAGSAEDVTRVLTEISSADQPLNGVFTSRW